MPTSKVQVSDSTFAEILLIALVARLTLILTILEARASGLLYLFQDENKYCIAYIYDFHDRCHMYGGTDGCVGTETTG